MYMHIIIYNNNTNNYFIKIFHRSLFCMQDGFIVITGRKKGK